MDAAVSKVGAMAERDVVVSKSGAMHYDLKRSMEDGSLDHSLIATANNEWAEVHGLAVRVRGDKESVQAWSQVGAIAA